jgi:hypothetical protein
MKKTFVAIAWGLTMLVAGVIMIKGDPVVLIFLTQVAVSLAREFMSMCIKSAVKSLLGTTCIVPCCNPTAFCVTVQM